MPASAQPPRPLAYDAYESLAAHYAALVETKPHNAYYEWPAMEALWPQLQGRHVLDAGCGPGVYAERLMARGATVTAVADASFDFVNAPLCLDYIEDWRSTFREFHRILRPGGALQFSCGHPAFDAEYFRTDSYFSIEHVECTWSGFGQRVRMPSVRRSLQEIMMPVIEAGFRLSAVVEPKPTEDFRQADPVRYALLMHRPAFLCVQAQRD